MDNLNFIVDSAKCIRCGICVFDCPTAIIELDGLPKIVSPEYCMQCQHCLAICPVGAISILGNKPEESIAIDSNLPDFDKLKTLMKARRSVRHYLAENIDREIIDELLDVAYHAPTGVNTQSVLLTVVDKRGTLDLLRKKVYADLEELIGDREDIEDPSLKYLARALKVRKKTGADVIFRGAPHLLIASAKSNSPCPTQDGMICLSYFELAAQANGLGTVWDGMFYWCISKFLPDLKDLLQIPEDHTVVYSMAFGKPAVNYHRTVNRGPANVNTIFPEIFD